MTAIICYYQDIQELEIKSADTRIVMLPSASENLGRLLLNRLSGFFYNNQSINKDLVFDFSSRDDVKDILSSIS